MTNNDATKKPETSKYSTPLPVQHALRKLGKDIQTARRRRRIPTMLIAERAGVSRPTLLKVEQGHPGVSMGTYARVLFALGILDRLQVVADASHDLVGMAIEEEHLPKRIHLKKDSSKHTG